MGMYTEVVVKINFNRKEIGDKAFNILEYMFNRYTELELENLELPDHPFFKCLRWDCIGNMSSFYHHPNSISDWYIPHYNLPMEDETNVYIFARNDLKNYDGEIDKFFDWIQQYNVAYTDEFIGYSLYEEDDTPKIYNSKGK